MDGQSDVGGFAAHFDGEADFGDQVAGVGRDDAGTDDAVTGFIKQQLGEAFGAPDADRAAGSGMRIVKTAPGRPTRFAAVIAPPMASTKPRAMERPRPKLSRASTPLRG